MTLFQARHGGLSRTERQGLFTPSARVELPTQQLWATAWVVAPPGGRRQAETIGVAGCNQPSQF